MSLLTTLINTANTLYTNTMTLNDNTYTYLLNVVYQLQFYYEKLKKADNYNFERFYFSNSFRNKDNYNSGQLLKLGNIFNTGKLVKFYVYANIRSWQICIDSLTFFKVLINNERNDTVYSQTFNITHSPEMTIEFIESVNSIPVNSSYTVNIVVKGSFYLICEVQSNNVQIQLEIASN